MPIRHIAVLPALLPLLAAATPAAAYIGPGAGAGTVAVVLGILGTLVMAFLAVLYYPIKRMLRSRKSAGKTAADTPAE